MIVSSFLFIIFFLWFYFNNMNRFSYLSLTAYYWEVMEYASYFHISWDSFLHYFYWVLLIWVSLVVGVVAWECFYVWNHTIFIHGYRNCNLFSDDLGVDFLKWIFLFVRVEGVKVIYEEIMIWFNSFIIEFYKNVRK